MGLLSVEDVVKRYGKLIAVDHVSFEARPGRILGLLGPNGAGKTSTIRMITNITTPDEGRIRYEGRLVGRWSQERMGYLPEERGLYKKMRVGEQMLYLAALKGVNAKDAELKCRYWLDRLGAADWYHKRTEELSKGMHQKIQFIATVMHDPTLLILDEPFGGLDPINAEVLREVIRDLRDDGRCILFASHRMEQVEQLCDDISLISRGRIILQGALREIKRRYGRNTIILEFDGDPTFADELEHEHRVKIVSRSHGRIEMRLLNGTSSRAVLEHSMGRLRDIHRFELVEPPLHEIFVDTVEKDR